MPKVINFDNRQIVEPGVYSRIIGAVPSPAAVGSYGNVMLIDTGSGAGFGFRSGVIGALEDDTVYSFSKAADLQKAVRGGRIWELADYLFNPGKGQQGAATVIIGRAATTGKASFEIDFGDGNGLVDISPLDEGPGANGVLTGAILTLGYGLKIRSGVIDTAAFILDFYQGQFKGLNKYGIPYDGIEQADITQNTVICSSDEFTTADQLIAWMNTSATFKQWFKLNTSTASAVALTSDVLTTYGDAVKLFAGGTISYSTTALDALLESIIDLDVSMFLLDDYGITPNPAPNSAAIQAGVNKGGMSAFNLKIVQHVHQQASAKLKAVYIGGGQDSSEYVNAEDGSLDTAIFYDDPLVHVMHSAQRVPAQIGGRGDSFTYVDSLVFAAMVCGLNAGLLPQNPATYKPLRVLGPKHELKKSERERALKNGVVHMRNVAKKGWVINQMVNTMQRNTAEIYADGTSPETSIMRIFHQANKEIVETLLDANFVGGNLATASAEEVKAAVETYLQDNTSTEKNLLFVHFEQVSAVLNGSSWDIKWCAIANGPINRLFSTGVMIDSNISA